jgi:GNAT superfamily N-acetyltransferase
MAEAAVASPRRATAGELPALARMLARAFHNDPVTSWACPPKRMRPRVLERLFGRRIRHLHAHDELWTSEDLASAAVWAPPDRWKTTTAQDLSYAACMLDPRLILRMPMVVRGLLGVEEIHPPKPPHWYLAILGTDPSAQGQGLGSAMIRPVLEECDHDGVAAYLESSKKENIAFYARHGFRLLGEHRLPRGPLVWPMWRDPR